jgi:hypothetical protein
MRHRSSFAKAHSRVSCILKIDVRAASTGLTAWLRICIVLFFATATLHSQVLSGINGTVSDQSGSAVPDAKITITNIETGVRRNAESSSAGSYYITDLIPGIYTVTVEKAGFKSSVQKNVVVQAGMQSTANTTLMVGDVSSTVEVTAPEISLQTEQPLISTTIQHKLLEELPIVIGGSVRQIDGFMALVPGVSPDGRIDGGLDFQNEVVFNGVPIAFAEFQGRQYFINPPFDLVKEFTVLQGAFSAQYGLAHGVAQYQFQSGTNAIHGNTFAIYRDAFFDAPGAFNDVNPNNRGVIGEPNTDHEFDWGFTAGGPLRIPKLYNGRNRTFWFASIEKFRQAFGQSAVTVPTEAFVKGDLSGLVVPGTTTQIPIFVPISWQSDPSLMPTGCDPGAAPGQQFPGNVIPQSCFSTVSKSLLGFVPKPTSSGEVSNFQPGFVPLNAHNVWGFTIDHNLSSRQAVHGVYWRNEEHIAGGFVDNPLNNTTTGNWYGSGLLVTYSHAITPRLMVTGGVSWTSENFLFNQQRPIGSFAGVEPSPDGGVFLPGIDFGGGQWEPMNWGTDGWQYTINRKHGLGIANNWLYTRGRHNFNFGVDIRHTSQDDQECIPCAGSLNFDAVTTADPINDAVGESTGNGFASFLLGVAHGAFRGYAPITKLRNFYIAPYFQDNVKLTPHFTLNWGLRWDLAFPFSNDNHANRLVLFNPSIPNPAIIDPATGEPRLGAMAILGKGCDGCVGWDRPDMQWKHFSPRLGFAYQLNSKTVLLAGLSFSFLNSGAFEYGTNLVAVKFGNSLNGFVGFDGQGQFPGFGQWDNKALPSPSKPTFSPEFFNGSNVSEIHRHIDQAYNELLSIGVQRELPWNMFTSVSYIHSHDLHLPAALLRRNQLNPKVLSLCPDGLEKEQDCMIAQPWTTDASQAILKTEGFGQFGGLYTPYETFINDYGGEHTPLLKALLPYPQFRTIFNPFDTTGADKYDGLQVSAQKRTSSGLTLLLAYTFSKTFSNTDSSFTDANTRGLNQFNPKGEWSVARDDRTHILSISQVYEFPFGPGKKFLNHRGTFVKNLVGGWAISGNYYYASGTPVQIIEVGRPLAYNNASNRANILPGSFDVNWDNYYTGQPVFNVKKFQYPGAWRVGNAAPYYSRLRNPFESNETLGLTKRFFFGERVNAELRVDFDNVLNRMQVCGADHLKNVEHLDGFGIVSPGAVCEGNTPRRGQAFFKITF